MRQKGGLGGLFTTSFGQARRGQLELHFEGARAGSLPPLGVENPPHILSRRLDVDHTL